MEEMSTITSIEYEILEHNGLISFVFLIIFIATIAFSIKKGKLEFVIKEVLENLFLCFLLIAGFAQMLLRPVENNDEIVAGLFFIAFGICRFVKSSIKKQDITS